MAAGVHSSNHEPAYGPDHRGAAGPPTHHPRPAPATTSTMNPARITSESESSDSSSSTSPPAKRPKPSPGKFGGLRILLPSAESEQAASPHPLMASPREASSSAAAAASALMPPPMHSVHSVRGAGGKTPVSVDRGGSDTALVLHRTVESHDAAGLDAALQSPARTLIDARDAHGYTPLMTAAAIDDEAAAPHMVAALLRAGADPCLLDNEGYTPLHWAAAVGCVSVVKALGLADRVNVNSVAGDLKETALHRAMRFARRESVAVLLAPPLSADPWPLNGDLAPPVEVCGTLGEGCVDAARLACLAAYFVAAPQCRCMVLHHADVLDHAATPPRQPGTGPSAAGGGKSVFWPEDDAPAAVQSAGNGGGAAAAAAAATAVVPSPAAAAVAAAAAAAAAAGPPPPPAAPLTPAHQESPMRVRAILGAVNAAFARLGAVQGVDEFPLAEFSAIERAHAPEYVRFVADLAASLEQTGASVPFTPRVQRRVLGEKTPRLKPEEACDTLFSAGTLRAVRRACGAALRAVDAVFSGEARSAFCVVRPPGHHAGVRGLPVGYSSTSSCGFCIFNTAMVAALHALDSPQFLGAGTCARVAIVDFDVHFGNGTAEILSALARPDDLFFASVHLYDKQFYPGTGAEDDFKANIMNIPLAPAFSGKGSGSKRKHHHADGDAGRAAWRRAIKQRLLFALRAFNPDLILLSAGFDGGKGDVGNRQFGARQGNPGLDLSPSDFAYVTAGIRRVADLCCAGRVVSLLEGGYGTCGSSAGASPFEALELGGFSACAVGHVAGLLAMPELAAAASPAMRKASNAGVAAAAGASVAADGVVQPSPRRTRRTPPREELAQEPG